MRRAEGSSNISGRGRRLREFPGIWEHLNNPYFKSVEFDGFRKVAGISVEFKHAIKENLIPPPFEPAHFSIESTGKGIFN
jgi:hypothetical protein